MFLVIVTVSHNLFGLRLRDCKHPQLKETKQKKNTVSAANLTLIAINKSVGKGAKFSGQSSIDQSHLSRL